MAELRKIQRHMAFMGWKGNPERGFDHKVDADGNVIARAHDETWIKDVEESTAFIERMDMTDELIRLGRERGWAGY